MSEAAPAGVVGRVPERFPPLAKVWARLRVRPDSEHELTLNRLALSGMVFGSLIVAGALGSAGAVEMLRTQGIYFALYYAVSGAFFAHILYRPAASPARRTIGICFDVGLFSYGVHIGGEAMAPFFPIYLWIILGNGFRFGIAYLSAAAVIAVAGFGAVLFTTDFWLGHRGLGIGLLSSLVFLPLYVSTLIRKLSAAKRQAEEASKAKSLFLASVSHELRTPLNAVIGLSDLLLGRRLDAEQREMTETIGQSGRSLLALINSILDFTRIEAGHMPKTSVDFDVYSLVFEIRRMLAVQADAKTIALAVHITPRVPRLLQGPRSHLCEILMNLAANAVKFTERGYVLIVVDAVEVGRTRTRLRLEVADTGIGIDPRAQGRIFDSFVQADETIIDRFGGTGLGLALVKQLVELHDGKVGVESTLGVGSTFWCELELEAAGAELREWSPHGIPVVLQSNDAALCGMLEATGADVSAADSQASAAALVAQMAQHDRRPLVVVDARSCEADLESSGDGWSAAWPPSTPAILVMDGAHGGTPGGAARRRFITALARPVQAASLRTALEIAATCDPRKSTEAPEPVLPTGRCSLRVLVAEDNRTNQKVIEKILERAGHRTQIAENGEEALDLLVDQPFDVVLMDVNMPVMNGIETTKLYRFASLGHDRVPILALTADASPEMEVRCREAGMDGCLTKPIEAARLVAAIEEVADQYGTGAASAASSEAGVTDTAEARPAPMPEGVALNPQVLDDLRSLGGNVFVSELAVQFLADAASLLDALQIGRAHV